MGTSPDHRGTRREFYDKPTFGEAENWRAQRNHALWVLGKYYSGETLTPVEQDIVQSYLRAQQKDQTFVISGRGTHGGVPSAAISDRMGPFLFETEGGYGAGEGQLGGLLPPEGLTGHQTVLFPPQGQTKRGYHQGPTRRIP